MSNNKAIDDLRRRIRRQLQGAIDSDRLGDVLPLLKFLDGCKHRKCAVSELPAKFRGEILSAAFEDELVEAGRRDASTGDNTIHRYGRPDAWHWEDPAPPRDSEELSSGGKSIAETLAVMDEHDQRMRRMSGFDRDVLWHVRLKHPVSEALAEWQAAMPGGKRRGASRRPKRPRRTEPTENQNRALFLRGRRFNNQQIADDMGITPQRVGQLLCEGEKNTRPSGRSVTTQSLPKNL